MTGPTFLRMLRDRGGNFGMMTAILLPVTISVGGMAIDLTSMMEQKANIQAIADAATLAAVTKMSEDDITEAEAMVMATGYLVTQTLAEMEQDGASEEELAATRASLAADTDTHAQVTPTGGSSKGFKVSMTTTYNMTLNPLTQLLGFTTVPISISSVSESAREGHALSMYLALDRSGSMAWDTSTVDPVKPTKTVTGWHKCGSGNCWGEYETTNYVTKINALKSAASVMFTELLKSSAPDVTNPSLQQEAAKTLIRLGGVSYAHYTVTEAKMDWGTKKIEQFVQDLPDSPSGGTDATGAMVMALEALSSESGNEARQQKTKGNESFERAIILMTDGAMTGNSWDWNESIDRKVRALCQAAKDDKITIFTVAFMAPDRGKSLLAACASSKEHYYESSDMPELVTAFGEIGRKAAKFATKLTN
jgi:Flp pilus assembly protein TadG